MTMTKRTIAERLLAGFIGPRPGSNAFPLLQLGDSPERLVGEDIEAMIRAGHLTAQPISSEEISTIQGGDAGPYGEIPNVDLTHRYMLTDAGRAALAVNFRNRGE